MRIAPANGGATLPPKTKAVKQKSAKSSRAAKPAAPRQTDALPSPALEPFTLELVRPAQPAQVPKGVQMHRADLPTLASEAPEHFLTVRLETGAPYEVRINGELRAAFVGKGWQRRARSVLSINATHSATPLCGIGIHEPVDGRNARPLLLVPVSALHAVQLDVDGQTLVDMAKP